MFANREISAILKVKYYKILLLKITVLKSCFK